MDQMISPLTEDILQRALPFLPQNDAVRTCVLSKSWRYLWYSRTNIEFSERRFSGDQKAFLSVIDKILQRYHDDEKLSIQEFLLEVSGFGSRTISLLENWIPIVLTGTGLKTFRLSLTPLWFEIDKYFALPQLVFQAQSLQELYLSRCLLKQIDPTDDVLFKRLRTLSLRCVRIAQATFEKIMSSCPLIEWLVLEECKGLRTVKVNNSHSLKHFDCCYLCCNDPRIEIAATSALEIIRIKRCTNWYHYHHGRHFPRLKSLYLYNVQLPTESFGNLSSNNFPCLEELELEHCYGFEEFKLSCRSIKRLTIDMGSCSQPIKALIHAPDLLYFKLLSAGSTLPPLISFKAISSCEWESDISVGCRVDSNNKDLSTWFLKLSELLKALRQSQISLKLENYPLTHRRIVDKRGGFYEPVVVEHLSLMGDFSCSSFTVFSNNLFRVCRPMYIYGAQIEWENEKKELVEESLCKILLLESLFAKSSYIWNRDLVELSMETFDDDAKEWHRFQGGVGLSECALTNKQRIRFRLKWRE